MLLPAQQTADLCALPHTAMFTQPNTRLMAILMPPAPLPIHVSTAHRDLALSVVLQCAPSRDIPHPDTPPLQQSRVHNLGLLRADSLKFEITRLEMQLICSPPSLFIALIPMLSTPLLSPPQPPPPLAHLSWGQNISTAI